MSITGLIVVVVVIVIGLGFVLESKKRSSDKSAEAQDTVQENEPLSADETGPTLTGRYRVQQMLQKTEKTPAQRSQASADTVAEATEEDEEELPDPFKR